MLLYNLTKRRRTHFEKAEQKLIQKRQFNTYVRHNAQLHRFDLIICTNNMFDQPFWAGCHRKMYASTHNIEATTVRKVSTSLWFHRVGTDSLCSSLCYQLLNKLITNLLHSISHMMLGGNLNTHRHHQRTSMASWRFSVWLNFWISNQMSNNKVLSSTTSLDYRQ